LTVAVERVDHPAGRRAVGVADLAALLAEDGIGRPLGEDAGPDELL